MTPANVHRAPHRTHRTHKTHGTHRHAPALARTIALLTACLLAGCATHRENLPTYQPAPPDATWGALRQNAAADLTASGQVTLWTDRGRATLDCAVASDAAGNFRLRAWKLDQAALDITGAGGELWVHAPQAEGDLEQLRPADIARAWRLLTGAIFQQPAPDAASLNGEYQYLDADGVRITVDRATRTARRFELAADRAPAASPGAPATTLTLDLSRFEIIEGRPWPTRLELRAGDRRARITLDEVEFAPPPAGAFNPPRRAQRIEQP